MLETEHRHAEKQKKKNKRTIQELKEAAEAGDLEAQTELEAIKKKRAEQYRARKAKEEQRMAEDPEYAAKGDEESIKKLADIRAYSTEAMKKSRQRMYEAVENGDPEAVKRYDNYRREDEITIIGRRKEKHHD